MAGTHDPIRDLEARLNAERAVLVDLGNRRSALAAELLELQRQGNETLTNADPNELVVAAERQARTRLDAEARRLAIAELERRIESQKAAIGRIEQDLRAKRVQSFQERADAEAHEIARHLAAVLDGINRMRAIGGEAIAMCGVGLPHVWYSKHLADTLDWGLVNYRSEARDHGLTPVV